MLRLNNSYCDYIGFMAGRESSMACGRCRKKSNLAVACTMPNNVSVPLGYNYQYAIAMPRSNSMLIAAISRGVGTFTVSEQTTYEITSDTTFTGDGTFIADLAVLEELIASFFGEGSFTAEALVYELISALFDAGSRPSASDIAWETWMFRVGNILDPLAAGYKLNSGGSSLTDIANAVWQKSIEGSMTAEELLKIMSAIQAGKTIIVNNGDGNATVTFRDISDTKNLIEVTMHNSERTNLNFDL